MRVMKVSFSGLFTAIFFSILNFSSLSTGTELSNPESGVPSPQGILTRSWNYFENLVQSAFEDDGVEKPNVNAKVKKEGKNIVSSQISIEEFLVKSSVFLVKCARTHVIFFVIYDFSCH